MTESSDDRPARRSIVVTTILLVAAAVLIVALRSWLDQPVAEVEIAGQPILVAESERADRADRADPTSPRELANLPEQVEPARFVAAEAPAAPAAVPVAAPVEPINVVLLEGPPIYDATPNPSAHAPAEAIRQATLRALGTMAGAEIMDAPPSTPRFYEADIVAVFSAEPAHADSELPWLLSMQLRLPDAAHGMSRTFYTANGTSFNDFDELGVRYAETILRIGSRSDRYQHALGTQ